VIVKNAAADVIVVGVVPTFNRRDYPVEHGPVERGHHALMAMFADVIVEKPTYQVP
jgi:hypothetical protein